MAGSGAEFLSLANKHVHMADSLFSMYHASSEQRMLLRALEHCKMAIHSAAKSIENNENVTGTLTSASGRVQGAREALLLYTQLEEILSSHKKAATTFRKNDRLFIVQDSFENIEEVGVDTMIRALRIVKLFVYEAGKSIMLEKVML